MVGLLLTSATLVGLSGPAGAVPSPGAGTIATAAGTGTSGYAGDGGQATSAQLSYPAGVTVDGSGNLYIADESNHAVRKLTPGGVISTVAGTGTSGFSGDGGQATSADLYYPAGVTVDGSGTLFIADQDNHRVRMVTPGGVISTVAGTGTSGYSGDNGQAAAAAAELSYPYGVTVDGSGTLFIADESNHAVRKLTPGGVISTVAGTGLAGYSGDNGPATSARLDGPTGVTVDGSGNLFIADSGNQRVRKVTPGGVISTVAGTGTFGYSGDAGPATSAQLHAPHGVTVDAAGNLYIADTSNNRARKVTPAGVISTVAGTTTAGDPGYSGDGGPATSAQLSSPDGVAVDGSGNLFIVDTNNNRVRVVGADTAVTPPPTPAPGPDRVGAGSQLTAGQSITASQYSLVMQSDGNLVEYGNGRALWSTGTTGLTGAYLIAQTDGNLVVYSGTGTPVWSTGTWGQAQPTLVIQPDGNLVVYTPTGAVWSNGAPGSDALTPAAQLTSGQYLHSGNGRYTLVMQSDGNLVKYDSTRGAVWASWTSTTGSVLIEQTDGNTVIYTPNGTPAWASNTFGTNPSLHIQNDGNLVAYYTNSARLIS